MRTMNGVILWYVLTLQRFFVDFTTCLGTEVSLSIDLFKFVPRFLSEVLRGE